MAAATSGSSGRRRFTPALISTVKDSFRLPPEQKRPGPVPELTPEPSPTEEAPPPLESLKTQTDSHTQTTNVNNPRQKRRFAPQLIETSRRCRRNGDTSPATRPADKTDITPWMNHIYVPKPRRRYLDQDDTESTVTTTADDSTVAAGDEESMSSSDTDFFPTKNRIFSRRESMTTDGLRQALEYERREYARAARKRQEADALLAAFPNYNPAKYEGVEHFHARESSEDEHDRREKSKEPPRAKRRRDSEVNWFTKEHQRHALDLAEARGEEVYHSHDDEDLVESPGHEGPPAAPMWVSGSAEEPLDSVSPPPNRGPLGEFVMPLIPETHVTPFIPSRPTPLPSGPKAPSPAIRPIGESFMPYIPSAPIGKAADMPYVPAPTAFSRAPAPAHNIGFRNVGTAARNKIRIVTPPIAGQDLKFRLCESPQHTKMEPDHPFFPEPGKELHRDPTGQRGLWMGYCLAKDSQEVMIPSELQGPHMIVTPHPPASPNLIATGKTQDVCEEPARMWLPPAKSSSPRSRNLEPKGVHLVAGLDERLKHEKEQAERNEKIAEEFGDAFVTQVYNYLSLGYPIMARDFDAELSKISHIPVEELRKDDAEIMSKGHIKLTMNENEREEDRGPRWHALKKYIFEWAKQHPNLSFDGVDPLHWGMRERRGSWAI